MNVIYTVSAEFETKEDAVSFLELVHEIGVEAALSARRIGRNASPIAETRLGKLILSQMEPGKIYSVEDFIEVIERNGYNVRSITAILSRLVSEKDVVRISRNVYALEERR